MSALDRVKRITVGNQVVQRIQTNDTVVYWRPRTFTVRAKPYPQDSQVPVSCIEENGVAITNTFSRSWYFFVWDDVRNEWSTSVDHTGAMLVTSNGKIPTARYDTYDGSIRAAQQQAFCEGIDRLPNGTRVVIAGNHAPEHYNAAMVSRIKRCGGSEGLLSWTTRSSYVLVGKVGAGEGKGFYEALDNIAYNGVPNCAEVTFTW